MERERDNQANDECQETDNRANHRQIAIVSANYNTDMLNIREKCLQAQG